MDKRITHDPARNRFEMEVEGCTAYIRYLAFDGGLDILSTQVPSQLEGKGIASALTKHVLEYARANRLKIIPSCSFTLAYIRRHPGDKDLEV